MDYPAEFSTQAQARIEAEKIRAEQEFDAANSKILPDNPYGDGNKVRPLFTRLLLRVIAAFGHEACGLGREGTWKAAQIDSETRNFLEVLTRSICRERGYDRQGQRLSGIYSEGPLGGIASDYRLELTHSVEWNEFQKERLEVAEIQACATSAISEPQGPAMRPNFLRDMQDEEMRELARLRARAASLPSTPIQNDPVQTQPKIKEAQRSDHLAQFPARAEWTRTRLRERGWDHNDPPRFGGPDRKTMLKILAGATVKEETIAKLVTALNWKKTFPAVKHLDVPTD